MQAEIQELLAFVFIVDAFSRHRCPCLLHLLKKPAWVLLVLIYSKCGPLNLVLEIPQLLRLLQRAPDQVRQFRQQNLPPGLLQCQKSEQAQQPYSGAYL